VYSFVQIFVYLKKQDRKILNAKRGVFVKEFMALSSSLVSFK
jgi:hypothetical protein